MGAAHYIDAQHLVPFQLNQVRSTSEANRGLVPYSEAFAVQPNGRNEHLQTKLLGTHLDQPEAIGTIIDPTSATELHYTHKLCDRNKNLEDEIIVLQIICLV